MKKILKMCILFFILLSAVIYYFDINTREIISTVQTIFVDNLRSIFPNMRGRFENVDMQINRLVIKNSTTRTIYFKTQEAKKNASSFIRHNWLKVKKFALKNGISIDKMIFQLQNIFKYNQGGLKNKKSNYLFDYKNMNIEELSAMRQNFINYSLTLRGIPYILGSEDPEMGLDCSSFVQYSAKNGAGIILPRTARNQYAVAKKISFSDIEPGDLVFFRAYGRIDHVGIYLGIYEGKGVLNGRNIFINSASEGPRTGVVISALDEPYWKTHYNSCGRIIPSSKEIVEAIIVAE
ncbi:C40 family peptidase [Treponema sp. UBA753]|uniref:C40 family peptidase n=1 Tax=Treponema sp. UBA753 TaxID=1947747 RepID=UPI0025EA7049|nr:C40 family peptidase [Treponema sp. UBA753]